MATEADVLRLAHDVSRAFWAMIANQRLPAEGRVVGLYGAWRVALNRLELEAQMLDAPKEGKDAD